MTTTSKETEIGLFPSDWEIKEIREIGTINGRVGWKGYTKKDLRESGAYALGAKHINKNNQLDLQDPTFLSQEKFVESPEIMVYKNDILIVQRGTIGKVVIIDREIGDATINPSMLILRLKVAVPEYLYYYLISKSGQSQIISDTTSTGVPMITQKQVLGFKIPLPPTFEEQTAIATALSDADAHITAIEKLIAKKRAIKQGVMQTLLTGKTRLKGFNDSWSTKSFGQMLKIRHGKGQRDVEDACGKYPILGTGGLMGFTNQFLYDKPSVLIGRKGTIDKPQFMSEPFWTVDTLFYSEVNDNASAKFLYYRFLLIDWYAYNEASGVPSLNAATIEKIEVQVPNSKVEQEAIAELITAMDLEVSVLEKKLEKQRQLKQGMMQNLLTGKIRLRI